MASSFTRFLDHTQQRTTVGRTPLDEWSARRKDFYLTTHNTHNWQTSMPSVRFEPTAPAGERPQTYALDRAAAGTSVKSTILKWNKICTYNSSTQFHYEYIEFQPSTRQLKKNPHKNFINFTIVPCILMFSIFY